MIAAKLHYPSCNTKEKDNYWLKWHRKERASHIMQSSAAKSSKCTSLASSYNTTVISRTLEQDYSQAEATVKGVTKDF